MNAELKTVLNKCKWHHQDQNLEKKPSSILNNFFSKTVLRFTMWSPLHAYKKKLFFLLCVEPGGSFILNMGYLTKITELLTNLIIC